MPPKSYRAQVPYDERGLEVTYPLNAHTNTILGLNSLAKLFCTGQYSSIIKTIIDDNILYVSLPEGMTSNGLQLQRSIEQSNIYKLKNLLDKVLKSNNHEEQLKNKVLLFTLACDIKNEIALNIVKDLYLLVQQLKRTKELNFLELENCNYYIKCLKVDSNNFSYVNAESPEYKKDQGKFFKFMQIISKHRFDNFLNQTDLNLLKDFFKKNLIKVDYQDNYANVHVEAKGVHFALSQFPNNKEFLIGLAKADSKSIGCCGACTVEFNLLEKRGIIVHRTADFPESFPPAGYLPSPNIQPEELHYFDIKTVVTGLYKIPKDDILELSKKIEELQNDLHLTKDLIANYRLENEQQQQEILDIKTNEQQLLELNIAYQEKIKQLESDISKLTESSEQHLAVQNPIIDQLSEYATEDDSNVEVQHLGQG